MIKVAVTGAAGRMGSGIIRKITEQDDMEVVAAIEMPNTPLAGVDAGEKAGIGNIGVPIVGSQDLEKALKESGAEVLVDFTIAPAAVETIKRTADCGVNLVVGTTGFTEEQAQEAINKISTETAENIDQVNNITKQMNGEELDKLNEVAEPIKELIEGLDKEDLERLAEKKDIWLNHCFL